MQRTQTYTIDGKTYESPEAMPADVRRKWDALANLVATFTAEGAARGLTQTNLKLIQRVVSGPGESRAGSAVPAPDATSEPSARALLGDTGSARAMLGETAPASAAARTRMLNLMVLAFLLPALFLAVLAIWSSVRITVAYGPSWWVAAAVLWGALTAGLAWGFKRGPSAAVVGDQFTFGKVMALTLGTTAISTLAVFGGVPALAHLLSARPGELVVSVEAKRDLYRRYACTPRLEIAEFTFPPRNYLCPGHRAFEQIQVGAKIRIEGQISEFGVAPDVFTWSNPR